MKYLIRIFRSEQRGEQRDRAERNERGHSACGRGAGLDVRGTGAVVSSRVPCRGAAAVVHAVAGRGAGCRLIDWGDAAGVRGLDDSVGCRPILLILVLGVLSDDEDLRADGLVDSPVERRRLGDLRPRFNGVAAFVGSVDKLDVERIRALDVECNCVALGNARGLRARHADASCSVDGDGSEKEGAEKERREHGGRWSV